MRGVGLGSREGLGCGCLCRVKHGKCYGFVVTWHSIKSRALKKAASLPVRETAADPANVESADAVDSVDDRYPLFETSCKIGAGWQLTQKQERQ